MKINSDNVHFILVEPAYPGNIGAAARAINTMGFNHLVLVNPCDYLDGEARALAHASGHILEQASVFPNLEAALQDIDFAIATTQRERGYHLPFFTPDQVAGKVMEISAVHRIAIVFGREKNGLSNDEIRLCDIISTAPAVRQHPSLNLAQTVMLYAYELFRHESSTEKHYQWTLANRQEVEAVYGHLESSLRAIGFVPRDNWDTFLMRFKRLVGRAVPEVRDVRLLHKILQAFDEFRLYGSAQDNKSTHSNKPE